MPPITEDQLVGIYDKLNMLEAGRAKNDKQIELNQQEFRAALLRTEEKFIDELKNVNVSLKTIADGKAYGCMEEDKRVSAIEKDVALLQKTVEVKVDRDFVDVAAENKARAIVALALVDAKKLEDLSDATIDAKIEKIYTTWAWIWKTFLGALLVAAAVAALKRWMNGTW